MEQSAQEGEVRGIPSQSELAALLVHQGYRCALSGRPLHPGVAALDHIEALSIGGGNEIANLQWLHKDINAAKNTMGNVEFIAMCREVVAMADKQLVKSE